MMKSIFKMFEPTEMQFTRQAISRLKWASILSFPFPVLTVGLVTLKTTGPMRPIEWVLTGLMLLSAAAFIYVCGSRLLNRAWTPDKYLDESEISRKRQSGSFAFNWTISIAMIIIFFWLIWHYIGWSLPEFAGRGGFGFQVMAILICWAFIIQAYKISQMLEPLLEDGESAELTKTDKKYWVKFVLYIAAVFTLVIGVGAFDSSYDNDANMRAIEKCGQGNVKSVSTKGLFQTKITCSNE